MELRERDALAVDLREAVDERREPEPEPAPVVGHAERDDDGARARHRPCSCPLSEAEHKLRDRRSTHLASRASSRSLNECLDAD